MGSFASFSGLAEDTFTEFYFLFHSSKSFFFATCFVIFALIGNVCFLSALPIFSFRLSPLCRKTAVWTWIREVVCVWVKVFVYINIWIWDSYTAFSSPELTYSVTSRAAGDAKRNCLLNCVKYLKHQSFYAAHCEMKSEIMKSFLHINFILHCSSGKTIINE